MRIALAWGAARLRNQQRPDAACPAGRTWQIEVEISRHDPNHRDYAAAEPGRTSDDRRVGTKPSAPQGFAHHHDGVGRTFIALDERTAGDRSHAEHVEESRGHGLSRDLFGHSVVADDRARAGYHG